MAKSASECITRKSGEFDDIEVLIENPIKLGFLLAFCESQYCVENVSFIIQVGVFRDIFAIDPNTWSSKLWRPLDESCSLVGLPDIEVDSNFSETIKCTEWPATSVHADHVEAQMKAMWENFFAETGE